MTGPDDRRDPEPEEGFQEGSPPPDRSRDDNRPRPKTGSSSTIWTIVTVVVVVLFLGGLLVQAVGKVRESAARLQTNNNLKQCALSIHTFHDNFNKLPPAFGPGGQMTMNTSMWVHMMPFIESNPYYNNLASGRKDGYAFQAVVSPYLSPSFPHPHPPAGIVNFAGNVRIFGHKTLTANQQPVNAPGSAVQIPDGPMLCGLKLQGIDDGTDNVIMLSTRYSNCGGQITWFAVGPDGQSNHGDPPSPGKGGFMGAGSATTPATKAGPITATFQLAPSDNECRPDAALFGHSFGTNGLSVALCDSTVRNIAPTMSPLTFSRAICPGDKQKLGDDWSDD